ncbi:hypothetical protein HHK36_025715 [Tetracentron sinense]|uniref:Fe2OG dioxygenase domain-containing protein n=1 Tax=Tetracentron sinense TaxID=13715 RepID=A0A834YJ99_TETSI|nr:hypothetical protein HHK36_025715 [Tetracentron sinense]
MKWVSLKEFFRGLRKTVMGSETPLKLPIIDFSKEDLEPGTIYWDSVRDDVRRTLEEFGCFEAVYDKVSLELHNAIFCALEELFDLPTEIKLRNTSDKPYYGYIGQVPLIPHYEGMGIDDALTLEDVQSFTNLMWPDGNVQFCELAYSFSKRVSELDQMVKRMVFESLGIQKYYESHIESTNYLLRLMKYKGPDLNQSKLGVNPHTDKSVITILHQNQVKGLEVETRDGEWISIVPSASSFIVMTGDAFLALSNGRLHCPQHRVMLSEKEARYSIGLFSFGKDIIQTPEELVDEEHPLLFKPFNNIGLLRFYTTEEGQKAESTVKAYCGV